MRKQPFVENLVKQEGSSSPLNSGLGKLPVGVKTFPHFNLTSVHQYCLTVQSTVAVGTCFESESEYSTTQLCHRWMKLKDE